MKNNDSYIEQMKNVTLFLKGKRLSRPHQVLYKLLYTKAARYDSNVINSTVNVISASIGWSEATTISMLVELDRLNLFNKMEMAEGKLLISIKNLEQYARIHH